MEFKGTKGKWNIGEINTKIWAENRKGCIADCGGFHHNQEFYIGFENEEMKANAKLISCAPEMLEALKYSLRVFKRDNSDVDLEYLEQLIKKATEV